jgi:hypothetical protein
MGAWAGTAASPVGVLLSLSVVLDPAAATAPAAAAAAAAPATAEAAPDGAAPDPEACAFQVNDLSWDEA